MIGHGLLSNCWAYIRIQLVMDFYTVIEFVGLFMLWRCPIGSVHPSESGTIAALRIEKGESQLDEKGNVVNTFNQFLTCRIDIYSPFRPLSLS